MECKLFLMNYSHLLLPVLTGHIFLWWERNIALQIHHGKWECFLGAYKNAQPSLLPIVPLLCHFTRYFLFGVICESTVAEVTKLTPYAISSLLIFHFPERNSKSCTFFRYEQFIFKLQIAISFSFFVCVSGYLLSSVVYYYSLVVITPRIICLPISSSSLLQNFRD